MRRPWLIVLLCLATVFNGVAIASSLPAGAVPPCEMTSGHDKPPSPCDGCGEANAGCLQLCTALGPVLLAPSSLSSSTKVSLERVGVDAAALFHSRAGPPGLQPPR